MALWISIFDVEDTEESILTNGEQVSVVGSCPQSSDWLRVCLNLILLLKWQFPDLNCTWTWCAHITYASEEYLARVVHGNL